jgi:phosphohistidine phosphatase
MRMRIFLLRHGLAVDRRDPRSPSDADRPLTPKGMKKTHNAARGLRQLGVQPDAVLTSPWLRAVQTAEIVCEAIGFPENKIIRLDSLKGTSSPPDLFRDLAKLKAKRVICVGHEPHLHQVIALALNTHAEITELKKAGLACLEMETISPPRGHMLALYPPKALRLLGK